MKNPDYVARGRKEYFDMGPVPVAAQTARRYAGRSLADMLRDLQALGLKVVFSSDLVQPMVVLSEPKSTAPRDDPR